MRGTYGEIAPNTGVEAELTRIGPGTMMGQLMRHYWIPVALPSELTRDGAPRLILLGEELITFRDSTGRDRYRLR
jgi:phthalate 4,5-dioxygenase